MIKDRIRSAILETAKTSGEFEFTSGTIAKTAKLYDEYKVASAQFGKIVAETVKYLQQEGYDITIVSKSPKRYKMVYNIEDDVDFGKDDVKDNNNGYRADEKINGNLEGLRNEINSIIKRAEDNNSKAFNVIPVKAKKTLVISDLHIPFELQGVDKLVSSLSNDFDTLIINGDFIDAFSMSTFSKEADIPLYSEVQRAMEYLSIWVKLFDRVIFNKGNHEMRIENYIGKHDKINRLQFMIDFDVLSYIVRELQMQEIYEQSENSISNKQTKELEKTIEQIVYTHSTTLKYGDAIIAHPTSFSRTPSKTVANAIEHYLPRIKDLRAVIIGHTHHAAKIIHNKIMGIESGALCGTLPYEMRGNIRLTQPTNGLVMLVQYDGITDINATNYFVLDDHVIRDNNVVSI